MRAGFRRTVLAGIVVVLGMSPAIAGDVTVTLDEARMVEFDTPVSTVYMGNPWIADITIVDPRHVFVLGKGFGTTNMIALNASGQEISERHVIVTGRQSSTVTLNRGPNQLTFACANQRCEAAPVPGDAKTPHDDTMGEISQRQGLATAASQAPASAPTNN